MNDAVRLKISSYAHYWGRVLHDVPGVPLTVSCQIFDDELEQLLMLDSVRWGFVSPIPKLSNGISTLTQSEFITHVEGYLFTFIELLRTVYHDPLDCLYMLDDELQKVFGFWIRRLGQIRTEHTLE